MEKIMMVPWKTLNRGLTEVDIAVGQQAVSGVKEEQKQTMKRIKNKIDNIDAKW